jgi:hypothetical protein
VTSLEKIAVWWLLPDQVAQLVGHHSKETVDILDRLNIPGYISREVRSAAGTAGRGRLWIPTEIQITRIISPVPPKPHVNDPVTMVAAGIVLWRHDVDQLHGLPGLVTDAWLNTIEVPA